MRAHSSSAGASSRVSARGPNGVGFGPSDDAIRHVGTLTILSGFGFAASSLLVASSGVASMDEGRTARGSIPQTAFGENVSVDPATLKQLARDIAGVVGSDDDDDVERTRTRALRILAQVTLFVDYHDDIIAVPEIASALIRCLEHSAVIANDPGSVGTNSTALSLQCLADLAKERTVREAIVKSQGALIAISAALDAARWTKATRAKAKGGDASSKGGDASSNDEDDDASGVASAARLAAELAGDATLAHTAIIAAGVPAAVVAAGQRARSKVGTLRRMGLRRMPSAADEEKRRETRRHAAAFAFHLVSSSEGRGALIAADDGGKGLRASAYAARDRIVHRYAVGALARLVAGSLKPGTAYEERKMCLDAKSLRSAIKSAMSGLASGDSQAACFATGMLRRVAYEGDEATRTYVASLNAAEALLRLAVNPGAGWAADEERGEAKDASAAARIARHQAGDGARTCALRALESFAAVRPLSSALPKSVLRAKDGLTRLAEMAAGERGCESVNARKLASDVLAALGV